MVGHHNTRYECPAVQACVQVGRFASASRRGLAVRWLDRITRQRAGAHPLPQCRRAGSAGGGRYWRVGHSHCGRRCLHRRRHARCHGSSRRPDAHRPGCGPLYLVEPLAGTVALGRIAHLDPGCRADRVSLRCIGRFLCTVARSSARLFMRLFCNARPDPGPSARSQARPDLPQAASASG